MRVGLFTARPLGEAVANIVVASGVEVVGRVHCASGWWGVAGIESADSVFEHKPDLVVSCLTSHIFSLEEICIPPLGIVNLHPAPLPAYRGCNSYSHAIINGETTYGVSLHNVEAGIDTGALYDLDTIPIEPTDTARSLHDRAQVRAATLFSVWWDAVINDESWAWQTTEQSGVARYYRRDSLDAYRDLADHPEWMHDRIRRALTFPPFDPVREVAA